MCSDWRIVLQWSYCGDVVNDLPASVPRTNGRELHWVSTCISTHDSECPDPSWLWKFDTGDV